MRGLVVSLVVVAGITLAGGCMLFTGGTDGYSGTGSGSAGGASCASAADCGDGGEVCCLIVSASATSTSGTCAPTCSIPSSYPQLCATNAECGDAGPCTKQSCTVSVSGTSVPVSLQACGTVPGCKGP
jgi:hypothetical protein